MLDYIRMQRAKGRRVVLTTAANEIVANRIAAHLDLFDEVIASTATHNLKGQAKADALVRRFGAGGFVYAGDTWADLPVWRQAAAAVLVNYTAGDRGESAGADPGGTDDRGPAATCRHPVACDAAASVGEEPAGLRADLHRRRDGQLA